MDNEKLAALAQKLDPKGNYPAHWTYAEVDKLLSRILDRRHSSLGYKLRLLASAPEFNDQQKRAKRLLKSIPSWLAHANPSVRETEERLAEDAAGDVVRHIKRGQPKRHPDWLVTLYTDLYEIALAARLPDVQGPTQASKWIAMLLNKRTNSDYFVAGSIASHLPLKK